MKKLMIAIAGLCIIALAILSCGPPPPPEPPLPPAPAAPPLPEPFGAELPPPEYELKNVPEGAVFDPETQTFSWQTQLGDAGIYPGVCFSVTDGEYTVTECITIIVLSTNRPPDLSYIPLKVVDLGDILTFTLQASDPDGDELEFFAQNLPPDSQFSPPSFSWLPSEKGIWPALTFGVTDGKKKTTQQVIIAVR